MACKIYGLGILLLILAIPKETHQFVYIKNCPPIDFDLNAKLIYCRQIRSNYSHTLNIQLKIAAVHQPPQLIINENDDKVRGYGGDIMNCLSTILNFSQKVVIPEDEAFGNFLNGNWTGMMQLLVTKEADIALLLTHTKERGLSVSFSPHLTSNTMDIIFRKQNKQSWDFLYLLKPFPNDVWLCIFLIYFFTSLLLLLSKLNAITELYRLHNHQTANLKTKFLFVWNNLLKNTNSLSSSQIILQCFYVCNLILYAGYTSRLTSLFAVVKDELPFESLEEMVTKGNYFPVVKRGIVTHDYFIHADVEPWISGWKVMKENMPYSLARSYTVALETVLSMDAALIVTTLNTLPDVIKNCSFDFAPKPVAIETESFAYYNQFPYKKTFNIKILWLRETGIISQIKTRNLMNNNRECDNKKFQSISLHVFIGPVVVIILGVCSVIVVFLTEKVIAYYGHKILRKNNQ